MSDNDLGMYYDPAELQERPVERTFIHCTATSNPDTSVADLRRWHVVDQGWSDIGYHYYIDTDGNLYPCRPLSKTPAAQKGNNTGTIAVCLNGLEVDDFNEAQFTALRQLCQEIDAAHDDMTFHGHCEVANKTCPVFDYRGVLGLDELGEMNHRAVTKPSVGVDSQVIANAFADIAQACKRLEQLFR